MTHHVLLVPGFFGFGSLGQLTYFVGVRETLQHAFERQGLDVNVVEVPTLPTASIRHRAARVHESLGEVAATGPGPIHVIGHSTGGLDARLAIAPTASLPTRSDFGEYERIRTLVTISTPHFGTPLASFFSSAAGYPLLRLAAGLSIVGLRRGHLPLGLGLKLARWVTRLDDLVGLSNTVADQFFEQVVADFSPARRAELMAFIEGVSNDQSLVFQLTPAGCDLLNASTADPDTLCYGSVVCRARAPRLSNVIAFKHNPYAQGMHALYSVLHRIASLADARQFPEPVPEQRAVLEAAFGEFPTVRWSDGIVPTLSQIWGEVIHAASADHLDVVGHYGTLRPRQLSTDWLPSRSGFDDAAFESLWSDVARFITREAKEEPDARYHRNVGVERTQRDASSTQRRVDPSDEPVEADDRAREALEKHFVRPNTEDA